jgi:signal transduction histidine kinase/ActR/RegA family two-component response regulator
METKGFLSVMFLCFVLTGCAMVGTSPDNSHGGPLYTSYRDIPGVTDEEISAIEALREQGKPLIYAACPSTESFKGEDGEIKGFTALFCDFLTTLFGIHIKPELHEWDDLVAGLESREIAFTGDLTATPERRKKFFMTDPIALRTIKYFRLENSRPFAEIAAERPLRYAFLDGAITGNDVKAASIIPFEMIFVDNYEIAYNKLKNGRADAFFDENTAEYVFDSYDDVDADVFFPLLYSDVSLTTQTPALEPIISVVQKMLRSGGYAHLVELYSEGHHAYTQNKFLSQLTEEEREYLNSRTTIPLLAEYDNYPMSFYNVREKLWQGVTFDVLKEVEALSGLSFKLVNDHNTNWEELLSMLESGEGAIVSELIRTPEREPYFHWSSVAIAQDYYALLSKERQKDITYQEIFYRTIGIISGSAHDALFQKWFPNHSNIIKHSCAETNFDALERGEVDLVMSSRNQLLYLTNYREHVDYKINFLFDLPFESTFGFHRGDSLLCSIVDKALNLINTQAIHDRWIRKVYDYRVKLAEEKLPLIFVMCGLLVCILALVFILMLRSRNDGKRLEREVRARTVELEKSHVELKEAMLAAESANRAKSDFLATMSHEIRTPMNAIMGIAQIQLQNKEITENYEDAFTNIHRSGSSLLGIINDILDLSKIETGKMELSTAKYDVPSLIHDAVQINVVRIGEKDIDFMVDPDSTLPSKLCGDELRLKQILNNLLSNAIKYTEKGHVKLTINHSPAGEDVLLRFSIEDTGQGLTQEAQAELFSEYQRFNTVANRTTEGTGLGLSITKRLVAMMGGKIKVESVYGKGSTFTVEIIQKSVPCEAIGTDISNNLKNFTFAANKQDRPQIEYKLMPHGKILVVDDVNINLYLAQDMLEPYQLNVEIAESGFLAVDLIKRGKVYDIIFMDHMMPEMDGIETAQTLRTLGYKGTIVALTANALAGNAEMFKQNGFDGFISKPVDIVRMDEVLNEFVRDGRSKDNQ